MDLSPSAAKIPDFYGFHKLISSLSDDTTFKCDFQRELVELSAKITFQSAMVTNSINCFMKTYTFR